MSDRALTLARAESFQVPALVADVGPEATKRFFEFFTVPIRNKNTRIAYYHAIGQFLAWCERAGKTPAFARDEVRTVLDSIDTNSVVAHRDKALLATLAYTCSRIGAAVSLKVEDYCQNGKRSVVRLRTKGGKEKEFPVHLPCKFPCFHG